VAARLGRRAGGSMKRPRQISSKALERSPEGDRPEPCDPLDLYGVAVPEEPSSFVAVSGGPPSVSNRKREPVEALPGSQRRSAGRISSIDSLRGMALLFMLGSHVSIVFGTPWPSGAGFFVFVLVAGALWKPHPLGKRWLQITVSALITAPLMGPIPGLNGFNILGAWAVLLPILILVSAWDRLWLGVMGGALLALWPIAGANVGLVMIGWALGATIGIEELGRSTSRLWSPRWLALLGRWPLTFYVSHAVLIRLLYVVVGG